MEKFRRYYRKSTKLFQEKPWETPEELRKHTRRQKYFGKVCEKFYDFQKFSKKIDYYGKLKKICTQF